MRAKISFRQRRWLSLAITSLAISLVWWLASRVDAGLGRAPILTGSTVLACLFVLVLLGVRRRLPFWPLGSVSMWTQIHSYTGLFAAGVYLLHVPAIIAGGRLEFAVSLLFVIVTLSGFYGIFASRTLPKKLTAIEGQHRFDLIDWHRQQLSIAAQGLLDDVKEQTAMRVLGGFYATYLQPFFAARPSLAFVVAPTSIRRKRLLTGLQQLDRYLETEGRETSGALAALVRRRDELDYQYALQLRLRLWVVIHAALSLLLIALAIAHAVAALRFMSP